MRWFRIPVLVGALVSFALGGCVFGDEEGREGQASYGWLDGGGGGGDGGEGCTLTRGYWTNHPDDWPVDTLTMGGVVYTKEECLAILMLETGGDVSISMSSQLIATLLNLYSSGSVPLDLADTLTAAHDWLVANADADGRLPFGVYQDHSGAFDEGVAILETLTDFNEGRAGVEHCHH
jgi:hypothetical protein